MKKYKIGTKIKKRNIESRLIITGQFGTNLVVKREDSFYTGISYLYESDKFKIVDTTESTVRLNSKKKKEKAKNLIKKKGLSPNFDYNSCFLDISSGVTFKTNGAKDEDVLLFKKKKWFL